uniref:Uncharacterized protein n=1 Tax=Craspedostauros australis TaxID=1486917 RepID=A0A7R9ZSA4_9STRA|mmetsp:Transcript_7963/g.21526  ORF Transcript_7963/g.21526 Transcript_7963/m.21526 type:complete len:267 (+) Transcript_7963:343-1143(+)
MEHHSASYRIPQPSYEGNRTTTPPPSSVTSSVASSLRPNDSQNNPTIAYHRRHHHHHQQHQPRQRQRQRQRQEKTESADSTTGSDSRSARQPESISLPSAFPRSAQQPRSQPPQAIADADLQQIPQSLAFLGYFCYRLCKLLFVEMAMNAAVAIFGFGIGVGIILADSVASTQGNGDNNHASTTAAAAHDSGPSRILLLRPATPSCRALVQHQYASVSMEDDGNRSDRAAGHRANTNANTPTMPLGSTPSSSSIHARWSAIDTPAQ